MAIVALGIDLAKNAFALHGVDARASRCCCARVSLLRRRVPRGELLELVQLHGVVATTLRTSGWMLSGVGGAIGKVMPEVTRDTKARAFG